MHSTLVSDMYNVPLSVFNALADTSYEITNTGES